MSAVKIKFTNMPQLKRNFDNYFGKRLPEVIETIVDANFIEAVGYAQSNAPWTDRTGDARKSIDYRNLSTKDKISFWLIMQVYYGVYLELANGGKYRILVPTMTIYEVKIKKDLGKIGVGFLK